MASQETIALIAYVNASGVPHRVTSVTEGRHAPGSYHHRMGTGDVGLAVDFAGPVPSRDSPELLAIFHAFQSVEHLCHELIYGGADYNIKNGQRVAPYAVADHTNHVHVSVDRGVYVQHPTPPAGDPRNMSVNRPPVRILTHPAWGNGYLVVMDDGGVANFGGAPFYGSLGNVQLARPIIDAEATPSGAGYFLVGSDGGVFTFGDAQFLGRVVFGG